MYPRRPKTRRQIQAGKETQREITAVVVTTLLPAVPSAALTTAWEAFLKLLRPLMSEVVIATATEKEAPKVGEEGEFHYSHSSAQYNKERWGAKKGNLPRAPVHDAAFCSQEVHYAAAEFPRFDARRCCSRRGVGVRGAGTVGSGGLTGFDLHADVGDGFVFGFADGFFPRAVAFGVVRWVEAGTGSVGGEFGRIVGG